MFGGGGLFKGGGIVPQPQRIPREIERAGRKMVERGIKKISPVVGEASEKINNVIDTVQNGREALERNNPLDPRNTERLVRKIFAKKTDLQDADHLYVHRGVYSHHSLYVGDGSVIHYSEGRVRFESIEEFSNGIEIEIMNSRIRHSTDEVIVRAYSRLGEANYNLVFNNCEHFVNWCRNGD